MRRILARFRTVALRWRTTLMSFLMKSRKDLHEALRRHLLALPGVTERADCGIHEDAFFVGRTMFLHIHGLGICDIRLPREAQERALAEGRARPHRWAPEQGYVTVVVTDEETFRTAIELGAISHRHFSAARSTPRVASQERAKPPASADEPMPRARS